MPGNKLCTVCRLHLQELLSVDASEEPLPCPSVVDTDTPLSSFSTPSASEERSITQFVSADDILQVLYQSPVKLGKPECVAKKQTVNFN